MDDDRLRWLQRERGICSDPNCDQPIAGWCADCDKLRASLAPKWCAAHLLEHTEAAGHTPYLLYDVPSQAEGQDA